MRRGLDAFPFPHMAKRVWNTYYRPGGKAPGERYATLPLPVKRPPRAMTELCIVANFVEVALAREGHANPVGINYLEKIQLPHLPSIYGAMLAGAGYILMGAGIPIKIPDVLDRLVNHDPATYTMSVTGGQDDDGTLTFAPRYFMERELPPLARPKFIAIVASNTLAATMVKRTNGRVDGFVIEGPSAGGHNAPPRGKPEFDERGEVVYGERDRVDLEKIRALGLPFWLAGGYGSPEKLREALAAGAAGIQMGTTFAFCAESGLRDDYKRELLAVAAAGEAHVATDVRASPTGFPFKVAQLPGTLSDGATYGGRTRICDLGYLREAYRAPNGKIGYRCAGEPVDIYVAKGGDAADTAGRMCICNALLAAIGLPQVRVGGVEAGIVTSGNDLTEIARFLPGDGLEYTASDVIAKMTA